MSAIIKRNGGGRTPDCARLDRLLPLYALGELDAGKAEQVRAHEAGCAYCQARLAEYRALRDGLADERSAGHRAPVPPLSLDEIMSADQGSDAEPPDPRGEHNVSAPRGRSGVGRRPDSRLTVRRWWAASREIGAIAAALLLTLAAALIFSSLRGATTLPAGPRIIEHPALNGAGGLAGLALGPDGNMWLTDLFSGQIDRVTPSGAVTRFNLPSRDDQPEGITPGPDGALWFAEYRESSSVTTGNICFDSHIGRITTSGSVHYFSIASNSCPDVITRGPDGALWFTARGANEIGRITISGAISEYPLAHAGSIPEGIAAGPDGALWFAERGANQIGRITTSGAISEYPIAGSSNLTNITAGPDGALWFTETGAIGRITTSGAITRFPLPSAYVTPGSITPGPNGALWFTEYSETNPVNCDGSHVGSITVTGHISQYAVTPNSCPSVMTRGPGGALWFIESARNAIGEIRPAG